jgi:hypothetical protein
MADVAVSSVVAYVLERLRGAVRVREHDAIVGDHWHTDAVVVRLRDGTQAYVRYYVRYDGERGRCESEGIRVVFEDGEAYTLTGGQIREFDDRFWDVVE